MLPGHAIGDCELTSHARRHRGRAGLQRLRDDELARLDCLGRLAEVHQYQHVCLIANPSEEEIQDLISKAQVNILPSFNCTGVKLKLLTALFNRAGHEALTAPDGAAALEILEYEKDIDAVVSDVRMPKIDGFQLCRTIRNDGPVPASVLIVSAPSTSGYVPMEWA